ncbi:nickel-dependent hydrogenase large subunit [Dongia sp.]|uniref:nickel-dependent hydrogenase large subunit n=1 Tax=Dongia sp. TaxID=1977262 RepID=UPI0035AE8F75
MTRRIIGPFNRVEGDLEVKIDISDARVDGAWVVSPLYRGFERMLHGKNPMDALVYAPRICGICSVSQSVAAATALGELLGISPTPNGELARNIILAAENVADHLTHFYLFFMPDFCRETYAAEPWFAAAAERFAAIKGSAARDALPARAEFMHVMGLLAGKWPHTLAIQPGGTSRAIEAQEQMRLLLILGGFRRFLERVLFGASLERIASLDSIAALEAYRAEDGAQSADFRHFLHIADALHLDRIGASGAHYLSYGNYWSEGKPHFDRGLVLSDGSAGTFDPADIAEDISHAWLTGGDDPQHPYQGVTEPDAAKAEGYSWCKAPRLAGQVVEVGAFARQAVDGQPLIRALAQRDGANVRNRVVARLIEIARIALALEHWARQLCPKEAYCVTGTMPDEGSGCGLVEAARGSLGHWIKLKHGRIINYQIVAPTTWNFSPRDAEGRPGALEAALVGAPVRSGEIDPVSVQHVVRSFDPCMVCTVH